MLKKAMFAAMALTLALTAGCSFLGSDTQPLSAVNKPDVPDAERTTIVFWNENAAADRTEYYRELIDWFEKENPDIHVEYVGLPKKAARLKINTAIATNEMPDVCGLQSAWIAEFCAKGVLLDLDPYFDRCPYKDDMLPGVLQANRDLTEDGGLYQLPDTMGMELLWYRSDWYREQGIDPPRTWDEFFADAAVMNHPEQGRYGFSIRGGDGAGIQLLRAMFAYSGDTSFFASDGHCVIDDPVYVDFVRRYLGLYRKDTATGDITNGYQEMVAAFDFGQAALIQHNIGSYGSHAKNLPSHAYAAAILPRSRKGTIVQEANNVDGYSIFRSSQHKEAAWRFVQFLCSPEVQSWWNERIGQIPVSQSALQDDWVSNRQHIQAAREALDSPDFRLYEPPMYLPDYRRIVDGADAYIEQVMMGKMSVEDFLRTWAGQFEREEQKYRLNLQ